MKGYYGMGLRHNGFCQIDPSRPPLPQRGRGEGWVVELPIEDFVKIFILNLEGKVMRG